jgi:hypothetical protein
VNAASTRTEGKECGRCSWQPWTVRSFGFYSFIYCLHYGATKAIKNVCSFLGAVKFTASVYVLNLV